MTSSTKSPSSSRDLTLLVENESGTPEEYFAQVGLCIGRASSNTIVIDHPELDRIHARVVREEGGGFWLRCEPNAPRLQVLEPEPGEVEKVELVPDLAITLGGIIIRCRQQVRETNALSDNYWADAAGGDRFRVDSESFKGDLPRKIGPYEIRRFVARGGMGIVLRGVHEETDHLAAVKLPTPDLNRDQQWLKRFEQEVRTLKSVVHPNLVRLQDAGKQGDLHWMAMDWVEGGTVSEKLAHYKQAGEPMPLEEIQLVLKQVVEGLMALHAREIVHRDLKPSNLLVGQDGSVKVADFGLAKQVGAEQSTLLTRTGTFAGTMHYMAPEQIEGFDITPITDVYALGVIWHELLTGKRPSGKFKLGKLRSDCLDQWMKLIEDCLDDEPEERPRLDEIMKNLLPGAFAARNAPIQSEKAPTTSRRESSRTAETDSGEHDRSDQNLLHAQDFKDAMGSDNESGANWLEKSFKYISNIAATITGKLYGSSASPGKSDEEKKVTEPVLPKTPWATYGLLGLIMVFPFIYQVLFSFFFFVSPSATYHLEAEEALSSPGQELVYHSGKDSGFFHGGDAGGYYGHHRDTVRKAWRENEHKFTWHVANDRFFSLRYNPIYVETIPEFYNWYQSRHDKPSNGVADYDDTVLEDSESTVLSVFNSSELFFLLIHYSTASLVLVPAYGPLLPWGPFMMLIGIYLVLLWWVGKTTECCFGRRVFLKLLGAAFVFGATLNISFYLLLFSLSKMFEVYPILFFETGIHGLLLPLIGFLWIANRMNPDLGKKIPFLLYFLLALALGSPFVPWLLTGHMPNLWNFLETLFMIGLFWISELVVGLGIGYLMYRDKTQEPARFAGA